jgi:hypothetical protein
LVYKTFGKIPLVYELILDINIGSKGPRVSLTKITGSFNMLPSVVATTTHILFLLSKKKERGPIPKFEL